MTKDDANILHNDGLSSTTPPDKVDSSDNSSEHNNTFIPPKVSVTLTDSVAAVTVAVLACVLLLTVVFIIKAIKRRRRAQRGEEIDHIPTVATGVMGTGVAAYNTNSNHNNTVEGSISWEPVTPVPSTSTSLHFPPRGDNSV
ncbi:hypothetical protein SNE40_007772 [Patella caerulea]|uniref:Uncharacterized protein n=1 Tax=Patella caerulea TaxID=87958 RepID=A0AAN8JUE1_PATCE